MNLSYYYVDKKKTFEKKTYFYELEKNYKRNEDKNFDLNADFYLISGWKEHASQQKPIEPGKAKNLLKDYLK